MNDNYFIAKGRHLVVPVTKQEYEDHWDKKRNEPITEEEWFCQLSTEEKAELIFDIVEFCLCYGTYPDKNKYKDLMGSVEDIKTWLKKPHKE